MSGFYCTICLVTFPTSMARLQQGNRLMLRPCTTRQRSWLAIWMSAFSQPDRGKQPCKFLRGTCPTMTNVCVRERDQTFSHSDYLLLRRYMRLLELIFAAPKTGFAMGNVDKFQRENGINT